ncbi:MFS transporter [Nonomuraea endophytica]|uniref:NNP family nitrate/nitrite transporter-like MFS transporter n=1 Tax=Nonomuraea endophytica TaxID=714136 RepID=A0A7W8ACA9_9ACTN|nr:MFS transporter [Nonomuraea endophytica]MBB5083624.1 NNP family nitrate/nitrite transporter-like MFS transporter [Nonomuraea endophytica]
MDTGIWRSRWIAEWRPDDPAYWHGRGRKVAWRNLGLSILVEHFGFALWTVWSVVILQLGDHAFSVNQLFWLVAIPNLVGAFLRIPYTFLPARLGGANFTVLSALLLLIPALLLVVAVSVPATPYWMFVLIAATAGLGGGNFASSMANITNFFPAGKQGLALGLNAAGGNIGVSSVQVIIPLVVGAFGLAAAGWVWVPLLVIAALAARWGMDNLSSARASAREQLRVARHRQTWLMSFLYIGTFGSFIGYSTAYPLLMHEEFPQAPVAALAFLGPLLGSLVRPLGGWLADRYGGAKVTFWNFALMGGGVLAVWAAIDSAAFPAFFGAFMLLFLTSGVGNGSTYRMIPAIFTATEQDPDRGRRAASAALGLVSAVGALGGFFINRAFGESYAALGGAGAALAGFGVFYFVCCGVTWWCYLRTVLLRWRPSLAEARV